MTTRARVTTGMGVVASVVALACASDDGGLGAGGAGASGQAGAPGGGAGSAGVSNAAGATGNAGGDGWSAPADPASVNAFLQARTYRAWPGESVDHPSTGPHGGTVRTYVSPTLYASLDASNAAHPQGAAVVKELYQDGKPAGFAYAAKVDADSAAGDGWYWYEVFTDEPSSTAPYAGKGLGLCKNCHARGGSDFVLTPFPLR